MGHKHVLMEINNNIKEIPLLYLKISKIPVKKTTGISNSNNNNCNYRKNTQIIAIIVVV